MRYDAMEAGREMDALVAEKVMGHTKEWRKEARCHCSMRESCDRCGPPLCYSTSISAAWEVVEKIGALDYPHLSVSKQLQGWECHLGIDLYSEGDTAPLAICRAALKSVG